MASQRGKLMPNLDLESTKLLNLTVLQRIDPFVEEILITAAHVTLYKFDLELNQWSRKDVEGSLFVVKRNAQPRFQFIVMNRRNTDNLVEDLLGDFEYEVQVPYLLYRNSAQEVNGIWFYNSHECQAIANLLTRILNAYSKVPQKPKLSSTKSEFEELEAVPTSSVIEGPLEPPSSNSTPVPDVPDDSFINFFTQATNIVSATNATATVQSHQSAASISSSPHAPPEMLPSVPAAVGSLPLQASATHGATLFDSHESSSVGSIHITSLLKPSFFSPVPSSSQLMMPPTAPPLLPPVTMQQPHGTPLLQPFPPPNPSPSLALPTNFGAVITRDRVRDALTRLVLNDQFVDMVYREIINAHNS